MTLKFHQAKTSAAPRNRKVDVIIDECIANCLGKTSLSLPAIFRKCSTRLNSSVSDAEIMQIARYKNAVVITRNKKDFYRRPTHDFPGVIYFESASSEEDELCMERLKSDVNLIRIIRKYGVEALKNVRLTVYPNQSASIRLHLLQPETGWKAEKNIINPHTYLQYLES